VSIDSPPANAVFAKQINVKFPLLSDMSHKMLSSYGILKTYGEGDDSFKMAMRANIVIDKDGIIRHIETGDSAVDPNTAEAICIDLHKKQATK